ncbi:phosphotransferase [Sphingobacterium sp. JUb56]|uniref:phosphotransferase n=1 Tax=Sphingobacterium sp. JUb56 TaxID=2587145 RepID=UPI00161974C6|nr:phosphotransferase [Sphingobacterium sp. JUb56]MBB2951206.1 RIO-like serine/threonine protein kinase [Sphingobacterium sp. JUb56]
MFTEEECNSIANLVSQNDWKKVNKFENDKYCITQFSSSLHNSDYHCYKVESGDKVVVVKITSESEFLILELLKKDGLPVPTPFKFLNFNENNKEGYLFEEYIDGSQLGLNSSKEAWLNTAVQLAEMHLKYWEFNSVSSMFDNGNSLYMSKIDIILSNSYVEQKWPNLIEKILEKLHQTPRTIIHGDAFPSNFLVQNDKIVLIDFGNCTILPYVVDIARLTYLPYDVNSFFCPNKEEVLDVYYEKVKSQLQISKDEFIIHVKMAAFIEIAKEYRNPICNYTGLSISQSPFDKFMSEILEELAKDLI